MADLPSVTIGTNTFPNFFTAPEKTIIGGIQVETALEQEHVDRQEMTTHPVQAGAPITDHAYNLPGDLLLRCGWSNASLKAARSVFSGLVGVAAAKLGITSLAGTFPGGHMSAATYVHGVYSQLLRLRASRQPFSVTTIRRKYDNMLIASLRVFTDRETAQALMVEAVLRELNIVNTSSTTLPPMENQQTPASTAEVQSQGTTSIQPATPAPGGALPPTGWGPSLISR